MARIIARLTGSYAYIWIKKVTDELKKPAYSSVFGG
jgi:hypothetical protein